jgi:hypothetical protein
MAKKWLAERWDELLPIIAAFGGEQEEELQRVCEAELAVWRARPQRKQASSLRVPLTDTRTDERE